MYVCNGAQGGYEIRQVQGDGFPSKSLADVGRFATKSDYRGNRITSKGRRFSPTARPHTNLTAQSR